MSKLIKKFNSGGQTDPKITALQNPNHDNWRDAYTEYSGEGGGSWKERRNFRKDWKNEANVKARVGEDTYDQLRATAEQQQFGNLGYDSEDDNILTREERRFDRRFNRRLRNGKYDLYLTKHQVTSPTNGYGFKGSLLFNMTSPVFRTAYSFGSYNPTGTETGDLELKPKTDWNAIATQKLGKPSTMQDVMALQKQLGVTIDGKWGNETQAAYDAYQQRKQNEHLMEPTPDFVSPETYFDVNGPSPLMKHSVYNDPSSMYANISKSTEQPIIQQNSNQFSGEKTYSKMGLVTDFDNQYIKSLGDNVPMRGNVIDYEKLHATPEYQKSFNSFKSQYVDTGWGGGKNRFVRVEDYQSIPKQFDENGQLTQEYKDYITNERAKAYMISRKQGGKMNKIKYFQQGGQMQQDQEELKLALTGYVVATKKQPKSEEEVQQLIQEIAMLKQKDPKTYAQLVQLGSQAQQQHQATMAKWGSKLEYIKSLKYAKGGKTCPSCQNGGKPLETPSVNKSLKKPIKKVEEKACGGKTKKR